MSGHQRPLWEQHTCLPLTLDTSVEPLLRYSWPGGVYVSVNVGYAPHTTSEVLNLLAHFRAAVAIHPSLRLADDAADIAAAQSAGQLVVAFDLEDSGPLDGDLGMVRRFYDLGVRSMVPTYNTRNAAGCGCLDTTDDGLTRYGHALVREMNAVGMVIDGSHCGTRTGLDLCTASERPVIYSHSCMRSVWDHPRNITDEQARECAATGGVIGIAGVGIFLGPNTATLDAMVRHIDHAVDLVGIDHVGIGSDYSFDSDDFNAEMLRNPHLFPEAYTAWGAIEWVPPEATLRLAEALLARGYGEADVTAILNDNFARVAAQVPKV
jgi:microsomal dipeptidase-like Zn-dependent dipeptidase